jgi:hypothetical protein
MLNKPPSDVDHELLAQQVSSLGEQVSQLETDVSDLLSRLTDIEKVGGRLEQAALTTSRELAELSAGLEGVL